MIGTNPYNKYREIQVATATPGQLLLMLYDGAIRFTREAGAALTAGQIEESNRLLQRAQDVLAELMSTLNPDAGQIAQNLYSLYEYMQRRLIEANIKKDPQAAEEVLGLLSGLREAWAEAVHSYGNRARVVNGLNVGGL